MASCDHSRWKPAYVYRPLVRKAERQAWRVVMLTAVAMLAEIVAGYWYNSMALLADGWHMASHTLAIGLTALAYWVARRYARDQRFAFGTWKVEVLAGFASAILLLVVVMLMAVESMMRFWTPVEIAFNQALWIAVIGLLVNLWSAWLLREQADHGHAAEDHQHHGHGHGQDMNRQAAFLHVLADALTSVAAIVALLGGKLFGWNWLDPLMGLVGAVVIAIWAKGLLLKTAWVLLDREMDSRLAAEVRQALDRQADTELMDFRLWRVGDAQYACALTLVTHGDTSVEQYKRDLAAFPQLVHLTVEVNRCRSQALQNA